MSERKRLFNTIILQNVEPGEMAEIAGLIEQYIAFGMADVPVGGVKMGNPWLVDVPRHYFTGFWFKRYVLRRFILIWVEDSIIVRGTRGDLQPVEALKIADELTAAGAKISVQLLAAYREQADRAMWVPAVVPIDTVPQPKGPSSPGSIDLGKQPGGAKEGQGDSGASESDGFQHGHVGNGGLYGGGNQGENARKGDRA